MRLRIVVQRHALPTTRVVWPIENEQATIAQLLEDINDVIPLEGADWGLEDYTVELPGGFECFHFAVIDSVLKDGDELVIRPLLTNDLRARRVSGRIQISSDGKHLVDGVAFGRPRLKNTANRPPVAIPPRKRPRIAYSESAPDDASSNLQDEGEVGEELSQEQALALLQNALQGGDYQIDDDEDDDDEEDEEYQPEDESEAESEEEDFEDLDEATPEDRQIVVRANFEDADADVEDELISDTARQGDIQGDYVDSEDPGRNDPIRLAFFDTLMEGMEHDGKPIQASDRKDAMQAAKALHELFDADETTNPFANVLAAGVDELHAEFPALDRDACKMSLLLCGGSVKNARTALGMAQKPHFKGPVNAGTMLATILANRLGIETPNGTQQEGGNVSKAGKQAVPSPQPVSKLDTLPRGIPDGKQDSSNEGGEIENDDENTDDDEDEDEDSEARFYDTRGFPPGTITTGKATTSANKTIFTAESSNDSSDTDTSDSSMSEKSEGESDESEDDSSSDSDDSPIEMFAKQGAVKELGRTKRQYLLKRKRQAEDVESSDSDSDGSSSEGSDESVSSSEASSTTSDDDSSSDSSDSSDTDSESESSSDSGSESAPEETSSKIQPPTLQVTRPDVSQSIQRPIQGQQPVPPGQGKRATQKRNQRRRVRNMLNRLVEKGLVPAGTSPASLLALSQNIRNSSAEVQEAVDYIRKNGILEENDKQLAEAATVMEIDGDAAELAARRQQLLDSLASRNNDPGVSEPAPTSPAVQEQEQTPVSESQQPQRNKVDLGASRRMLFGALGLKAPKNKADEQKIKDDLLKLVRPVVQKNTEAAPAAVQEDEEDENPDAWRQRINLSAVECCHEGIELSEPPFPFVQRWDPQQQTFYSGGRGGKGKRQQRNNEEFYEEERPAKKQKGKKSKKQEEEQDYDAETDWASGDLTLNYDETVDEDVADSHNLGNDLPPLPVDMSSLDSLTNENATEGAIIAFKQLVMSEATGWQPQISGYKTAVLNHKNDSGELELKLAKRDCEQPMKHYDEETGERVYGKFEVPDEDEEEEENSGILIITLSELIEPKLVQKASSDAMDNRNDKSSQIQHRHSPSVSEKPVEAVQSGNADDVSGVIREPVAADGHGHPAAATGGQDKNLENLAHSPVLSIASKDVDTQPKTPNSTVSKQIAIIAIADTPAEPAPHQSPTHSSPTGESVDQSPDLSSDLPSPEGMANSIFAAVRRLNNEGQQSKGFSSSKGSGVIDLTSPGTASEPPLKPVSSSVNTKDRSPQKRARTSRSVSVASQASSTEATASNAKSKRVKPWRM